MLSRIFLRYVDRFGCDYHRLSATDLQCLFIIIDSMGGNCQYEIFKELQSSPGFRGLWWRPDGRKYKKGAPLRGGLYRKVVFASLKGATAALGG